jgi:hypothetical protein
MIVFLSVWSADARGRAEEIHATETAIDDDQRE